MSISRNYLATALTPKVKSLGILTAILLSGVVLSLFDVHLVSSAANTVDVVRVVEAVPTDPRSSLWERAKESEIPLSAQQIYQPGGGSTRSVKVRALEDGHNIAIRVSWNDDSRDDTLGSQPSDAAALQLPIDPTNLPYQCMGQSSSRVNIWQWKAALEKQGLDNVSVASMEAAGTRNLTSNGICKAVDTPGLEPRAHSYHDGQAWHVVFYREMHKGDSGSAPLVRGTNSAVAFAVWNGARGEARGMKAVSTWNTLLFETTEVNQVGNIVTLGFVIALSAGVIAFAMRRFAS
jgi:DMSO reductase family type II enzyme heme b subunit